MGVQLDSSISFACGRDPLSLPLLPAVGAGTPHTGLACGRTLGASATGKLGLVLYPLAPAAQIRPSFLRTRVKPGKTNNFVILQ